jgi:hypothetical protein
MESIVKYDVYFVQKCNTCVMVFTIQKVIATCKELVMYGMATNSMDTFNCNVYFLNGL